MGGAQKSPLWWKGHQLDQTSGACASWQRLALGGALLEGTCCSITGSSIPSLEGTRGIWSAGSCSARPDVWDLKAEERLWYFITGGSTTIEEGEMSKGWGSCSVFSRFSVLSVPFQNKCVFREEKTMKWSFPHFLTKIQTSNNYNLFSFKLKKKSCTHGIFIFLYIYF